MIPKRKLKAMEKSLWNIAGYLKELSKGPYTPDTRLLKLRYERLYNQLYAIRAELLNQRDD